MISYKRIGKVSMGGTNGGLHVTQRVMDRPSPHSDGVFFSVKGCVVPIKDCVGRLGFGYPQVVSVIAIALNESQWHGHRRRSAGGATRFKR